MPIYEYGCSKCGHEFEELVFGNTKPKCPECGSMEVEKLMSTCCHTGGGDSSCGCDMPASSTGGGCAGCSGGHCASCGH